MTIIDESNISVKFTGNLRLPTITIKSGMQYFLIIIQSELGKDICSYTNLEFIVLSGTSSSYFRHRKSSHNIVWHDGKPVVI